VSAGQFGPSKGGSGPYSGEEGEADKRQTKKVGAPQRSRGQTETRGTTRSSLQGGKCQDGGSFLPRASSLKKKGGGGGERGGKGQEGSGAFAGKRRGRGLSVGGGGERGAQKDAEGHCGCVGFDERRERAGTGGGKCKRERNQGILYSDGAETGIDR